MKLLVITQKVDINDDLLGFAHSWLAEFAKYCEKMTVICLEKGESRLPDHVKIFSLGKESGRSRLKYAFNFYKYIWRRRKEYDKVFVHMNAEYAVLGGLAWRFLKKKIGLWYVHKNVDLKLKLAEKLSHIIFTASPESFRLKSAKVKIVGHGIDLNIFGQEPEENNEKPKIVYVGRISRIKNQKLLLEALDILVTQKKTADIKVELVGRTVYKDDEEYQAELREFIKKRGLENRVSFAGGIPNRKIAGIFKEAQLSVNLCPTGGMDKAVLESMASSLPVIVYNKTFEKTLAQYENYLILDEGDPKKLADKISAFLLLPKNEREAIGENLRLIIEKDFNLSGLIKRIIKEYEAK